MSGNQHVRVFDASVEYAVHKAGRARVRRQDAGHLALEKEYVARAVCGGRESAVESIGHLIRRIVFRIHGDRQINELLVRLVFDRKPDGLNAEFCKVFSKTSLAFMRPKRTRPYPYAGRRLL